jgi:hypothetical protein
LRTPTSPAFTLLGIAPSSVERPNTPASFALSILNRTETFSTVPKDFALELSPYWLLSHRSLGWRQDGKRSLGQSFLRTLTVSAASANTGTDAAPMTSVAIGARTSILSGALSRQSTDALEKLEVLISRQGALVLELLQPKLALLDSRLKADLASLEERSSKGEIGVSASRAESARLLKDYNDRKQQLLAEVLESDAYREHPLVKEAKAFAVNREGVILELAGAAAWDFPGDSWEERRARQWGLWITPSYQRAPWSLVGVGRYLRDEIKDVRSLEFGGRAIYSRDRYALSIEYLRRDVEDGGAGNRVVAVVEYQVLEGSWASVSIGKSETPSPGATLVAQIGLSINFSRDRHSFE